MTPRWALLLAAAASRGLLAFALVLLVAGDASAQSAPPDVLDRVQQSLVKVYGAGGIQGIEAYQSGFIAGEKGRVVTADSLVLEQGEVTVVLASGDRYAGRVVGADPLLRVAVVEFDPAGESLTAIDLSRPHEPQPGEPLLAFSNLFNIAAGAEPGSVMRTHLSAVTPREIAFGFSAPRGSDRVLLVDSVTSNPGAAGGLLTDYQGRPVGMIGNEVEGRVTGGWLNYAIPASQVAASAQRIVQGEQIRGADPVPAALVSPLDQWGFALVEDIAPRTPPYVELVRTGSAAQQAGMQSDDLVVMVDNLVTATVSESLRVLTVRSQTRGTKQLRLTVEREGQLIEIVLPAQEAS
ncbi:Serine endoprotease DegS [Posidoniimonas polymericola]|uniref:Serine endoprotease DegS n=1 Tax=Posidoniimonas polymericola TaxID=2528002 RepID=A0A5C5YLM6_9BACT|nr:trypsin-like peptidase domain-containing protein [Posidoniimonas polymericola]TWT75824.1 Serine endoprotease DegS [Posidoniimonas polymericola]